MFEGSFLNREEMIIEEGQRRYKGEEKLSIGKNRDNVMNDFFFEFYKLQLRNEVKFLISFFLIVSVFIGNS